MRLGQHGNGGEVKRCRVFCREAGVPLGDVGVDTAAVRGSAQFVLPQEHGQNGQGAILL